MICKDLRNSEEFERILILLQSPGVKINGQHLPKLKIQKFE